MESFSIKGALRAAWHVLADQWLLVLPAAAGIALVQFLVDQYFPLFSREQTMAWSLTLPFLGGAVVYVIWTIMLVYSLTVLGLALRDGWRISQIEKWNLRGLPAFALALVMFYVGLVLGFVALFIPGIIFGLTFMFFAYIIVDQNRGVVDSFRESARITKGYRTKLLGFNIICVAIVYGTPFLFGILLGIWAAIFGIDREVLRSIAEPAGRFVITVAFIWYVIASTDVYRQLLARKQEQQVGTPSTELASGDGTRINK